MSPHTRAAGSLGHLANQQCRVFRGLTGMRGSMDPEVSTAQRIWDLWSTWDLVALRISSGTWDLGTWDST